MAFYYSVDHMVSDPVQQLELTTKYRTDEPLEWLAKDAADHWYITDSEAEDWSQWPITFHLYDNNRKYLGGFIATPRKVGAAGKEWGITFDIEEVLEAA